MYIMNEIPAYLLVHRMQALNMIQSLSKQGQGLGSAVQYVANKILPHALSSRLKGITEGPREKPPQRLIKQIDALEGHRIIKMWVCRKRLKPLWKNLLNALSFGKFNKKQSELGYDQIYHNYMLLELDNGKQYKFEKNHVVELKPVKRSDWNGEIYEVKVPHGSTIKSLINNATRVNHKDFWQYNGKNNNCQRFVDEIIRDNHIPLNDPKAKALVEPQNVSPLIDTLGPLEPVPKLVTDTAGIADRVIHGDSVRIRRRRKIKSTHKYI